MINDYKEVRECVYKDEHYLVRDNGAVMRHLREGKKARKDDGIWTFGIKNSQNGYMHFGNANGHRVHIIVATAFLGTRDSKVYVVDHIDTNRCNNRVENLRWFTKLENALNNDITRNKIIYICGSIEAFIENPSILRERLVGEPSLEWMRSVSKEEATIAYENIKRYWEDQAKNPKPLVGGKMNDSVYRRQQVVNKDMSTFSNKENVSTTIEGKSEFVVSNDEWEQMTRSLRNQYPKVKEKSIEQNTPLYVGEQQLVQAISPTIAWQKRWRTPTSFLCCPSGIGENTIEEYFKNLIIDGDYNSTLFYGDEEPYVQKIVDKAYIDDNNSILVLSVNETGVKPYALSKIYNSGSKIIHESMGTFFEENGARKQFTIAQGLEWTGGESIDDYY